MENFTGQCIVVKVGTSTLTYENGKLNIRRVEQLARVLSDLQNAGNRMVLVSSGAIGVGVGKLGLSERPHETEEKQAVAAVGQCELMFMRALVRSNAVKLFGVNCILTQTDIYLPGSGKDKGTPEGTIAYDEATDTYHGVLRNGGIRIVEKQHVRCGEDVVEHSADHGAEADHLGCDGGIVAVGLRSGLFCTAGDVCAGKIQEQADEHRTENSNDCFRNHEAGVSADRPGSCLRNLRRRLSVR